MIGYTMGRQVNSFVSRVNKIGAKYNAAEQQYDIARQYVFNRLLVLANDVDAFI